MISGIGSSMSSMQGMQGNRPQISKEEMFSKIDSDSTSSISEDEFSSFMDEMKANAPSDASSSTKSTEDIFAEFDVDGSGDLSAEEMDTGMQSMRPEGSHSGGGGGGRGMDSLMQSMDSSSSSNDLAALLESSSNSSSSSSDTEDSFDSLDTNEDGVVSATERSAVFEAALSSYSGLSSQMSGLSSISLAG